MMVQQQSLIPTPRYYIIDNNIINEIARRSYPPNKYPDLHKALEALISEGVVKSVREVHREFLDGHTKNPDPSLEWCERHESIFLLSDDGQEEQMPIVSQHFEVDILKSTRPYADPHLVAHALSHDCIIVTTESTAPNLNKPKIPEIAAKLGADCCDIWRFFKETGLIKHVKA